MISSRSNPCPSRYGPEAVKKSKIQSQDGGILEKMQSGYLFQFLFQKMQRAFK
jgi:hypothetical protein